jgi:hypothetical protein
MSLPIAAASLQAYTAAASVLDTPRAALDVIGSRLSIASLNPQPLPPGGSPLGERFDAVALNPQPLPPGEAAHSARLDHVALNPQPLPPRDALQFAERLGLFADDFCGTVPRKLPVPPVPGPGPLR